MKFWLGVTDNQWFNYVSSHGLDEVNFWQPSATPPFKDAHLGMPFLFKLKRPHHHIAGGGFFVTYTRLPISLAWEIFGDKNGAGSLEELIAMLGPLTSDRGNIGEIGCTVLANPFFLPRDHWISDPAGWSGNIVRGKMYDSAIEDGASIWAALQIALSGSQAAFSKDQRIPWDISEHHAKYGNGSIVKPRLGQSSFRVLVTDAYKRRCAITGETTLVALEAAHIVPYSKEGCHDVQNGLLLRADFHRLFDAGLVSVDLPPFLGPSATS
ncbi:MAG: HNH endonuclease signature motif containing protein [Dokdonella sp.]